MLEVKNLHLSIGETSILNGVELSISENEKVGLIGPNGSGKTTLFNTINGFHRATSGNISFLEKDITKLPPYKRARMGLGRVFQNFGIFKEMTVLENVITAIESHQLEGLFAWTQNSKDIRNKAEAALEEVGLSEKAKAKAASLSGGQMRLLEIARTIAFGANLFLLDEPTAGVSPKMKRDVISVLEKLSVEKTILIIEHDMNFIQQLCDRIVVLDMGRVVLDGTPAEIRSNPLLQDIYFGREAESA